LIEYEKIVFDFDDGYDDYDVIMRET
jgi:hypothetical protein